MVTEKKMIDHVYSVNLSENGTMFGDKQFDTDTNDFVIVDGVKYKGMPGLYELIFKRIPDTIDVQLCFRRFFSEIRGFIVKNWLYIYDSKYYPSPLLCPIFRVAYESHVEKTGHLLKLSTNRSNFLLLHKIGSAGQLGRVPLIETSDSQREQRLENTAGGIGLPISTFPSMSWPLSQHGIEHCHAAKSLYRVSCIAAVCLSMLGSNTSIAFDTDRLWLFKSVLTVHNTLRRAGPTKYRVWLWSREYSVWPSTWKHGREFPMIFCAWDYRNEPIFRPQSQCDAEIPSVFAFQAASQENKHRSTTSFSFNSYGTQFPCFWIILMALRRFEMAWVTPNDRANSSWFWHESCSSNASNSASLKTFFLPQSCRSSTSKSPFLKRWNHSRHILSLIAASSYKYLRAFEPQPQISSYWSKKLKPPANDENLARKLTFSIENNFMIDSLRRTPERRSRVDTYHHESIMSLSPLREWNTFSRCLRWPSISSLYWK